MRAGPLSNNEVIQLLNTAFAPVFISNEDYDEDGPAPPEERAERDRIWREAREAGLSSGTVHAYVLAPHGRVVDSLHVAEAAKVERTREMLQRAIVRFRPQRGKPLFPLRTQSPAPEKPEGGLVLHLFARYLEHAGDGLAPLADTGLGQTVNASWQAYPAENWIVLERRRVKKLLGDASTTVGHSWRLDRATASQMLVHCYPSTECNDATRNRIDEQELTATVVSSKGAAVLARLDGRLRMKHNFYPGREDRNFVETTLIGYLEYDPAARRVQTLRLATRGAKYGSHLFGVVIRSVEPDEE